MMARFKSLAEFAQWLNTPEAQHAEIIVSEADYRWVWERLAPTERREGHVLVFAGRRIRSALNPEPKDMSGVELFGGPS